MSKVDTLRNILGSETSDKTVLAQAILDIMKTAVDENEVIDLLAIVLTERDSVPKYIKQLSNKGLPPDMWDQFVRTHAKIADDYLKMAFYNSSNVKDFASYAVRLINLFESEDEKTFILAEIIYSYYVPYHELPGEIINMADRQFQHIIDSNPDKAELIRFVTQIPWATHTELASVVLPILDGESNKEVRVALFAYSLALFQRKLTR